MRFSPKYDYPPVYGFLAGTIALVVALVQSEPVTSVVWEGVTAAIIVTLIVGVAHLLKA